MAVDALQGRASKADARYTPDGTPSEHCGNCRHFDPPHGCDRIAGSVKDGGWCRFWSHLLKAA